MYLVPEPSRVWYKDSEGVDAQGYFSLRIAHRICLGQVGVRDKEYLFAYGKLLQQEILEDLGFEPAVLPGGEGEGVFLTVEQEDASDAGYAEGVVRREGYRLVISERGISVCGAGLAGVLYGVQTLRQIIRQCGCKLPLLEIEDAPKLAHRGLSYDVTRGRVPTLAYLKRLADRLSFYKYNQLQLYVEHTYLFREFSEVWRDNTPLTSEEILELDAYCKKMQIELVPSLASFGHLYEVLTTKSYGHLCELDGVRGEGGYSLVDRMGHHTVDVSNEKSFAMVCGRIAEYMELFSSGYFNICADETFDLGKGKSKALGERLGVRRVYVDFLKKLCDFCIAQGKTPMFWGDVLVEQPELLRELPQQGICLNWEYDARVTDKQVKALTEAGVKHLYLCPGVQSWNHLINRYSDAYANILGMCRNAHKYHAEGLLGTEWGDLGHIAHPEFSVIGQIYGGAFSWSDKEMSEEEINCAISVIHYGDCKGEVVNLLRDLADCECVNWWHAVQFMEEQSGILKKESSEYMQGILAEQFVANTDKLYTTINRSMSLMDALYDKLTEVSAKTKGDVAAYLLMGEGQQLLAYTGVWMDKRGVSDARCMGASQLAVAWEHWLLRYQKLWRSVSKESELHRIVKVICWYADRLREREQ